jgi:hypothetical protein
MPTYIDVYEEFGISRSFRRGATSTAREQGGVYPLQLYGIMNLC